MKKILSKIAFTLVEIIIATFIGTIILAFIFVYLGDIIETISKTRNETKSLRAFYDFSMSLSNYRNIYATGGLIINTQTGSDILMLTDVEKTDGILVGMVDLENYKLSTNNQIYKNFSVGFRQLTAEDINNILGNETFVYDLLFQKDNVFNDLKVQDFQLDNYNSGKVLSLDLVLNLNYYDGLKGSSWDSISKEDLLKVNLNF